MKSYSQDYPNLTVLRLPEIRIPVRYKEVDGKITIAPSTIENQLPNLKLALENCEFLHEWLGDIVCGFFDWDMVQMCNTLRYLDSLPPILREFLEKMATTHFFSPDLAIAYYQYKNTRQVIENLTEVIPEYFPLIYDDDDEGAYYGDSDDDDDDSQES